MMEHPDRTTSAAFVYCLDRTSQRQSFQVMEVVCSLLVRCGLDLMLVPLLLSYMQSQTVVYLFWC